MLQMSGQRWNDPWMQMVAPYPDLEITVSADVPAADGLMPSTGTVKT